MDELLKIAIHEIEKETGLPASFLKPISHNNNIYFNIEDRQIVSQLKERLSDPLQLKLKSIAGKDIQITFRYRPHVSWLNPSYTLDSFLVDSSNEIAYRAISDFFQSQFNFLYLSGPSGCGKTHLLHGAAHLYYSLYPEKKVSYVTFPEFREGLFQAISAKKSSEFKILYRNADLFIADDIGHLSSASLPVQEEFFFLFNHYFESGKKIILAGELRAEDIQVEKRLKSRLLSGFPVHAEHAEKKTLVSFFHHQCAELNLTIPEKIINLIQENNTNHFRGIETIINKIYFLHQNGIPVHDESILLKHISSELSRGAKDHFSLYSILKCTCLHYHIEESRLLSDSRKAELTLPRHVAMYIAVQYSGHNKTSIARFFKRSDHTTVIHAVQRIKKMVEQDPSFQTSINKLVDNIRKDRG